MNEIIISPNYAVLVFHDKSTKFITEDQFNNLVVMYSNPNISKIQIDSNLYAKNSISKILTLDEYYREYPASKPEPQKEDQFKKYEGLEQKPIGKNGLAQMIKGLKRFIDEEKAKGIQTPKASFELDRLLKRYEILEKNEQIN
jgi:hypothetical protein